MKIKKITFLVLLGFIGMFLSEFLIWNVSNFLSKGPLQAILTLFLGAIMYITLFSLAADAIYRLKIRDPISLILLGSIYGIILESIFSDLIYREGFGPLILGLSFSRIAFTTVSWHAVIDFFLGFFIISRVLRGETILSEKKIKPKQVFIIVLFSLFWFSWSYSASIFNNLPQGIPLTIRILGLLIPMISLGVLLKIALSAKDYEPDRVLDTFSHVFCLGYIGIFVILRLFALYNKILLLSVCVLIFIYIILLAVHLKFGRVSSNASIVEESFPVSESFSLVNYLIVCAIVASLFIIFSIVVNIFHLEVVFYYFTVVFTIACFIFAPVFPIYVLINIFVNRKKQGTTENL